MHHRFYKAMKDALAQMPLFVRTQFPSALRDELIEHSNELDRLRAEVNELRSLIEKKE